MMPRIDKMLRILLLVYALVGGVGAALGMNRWLGTCAGWDGPTPLRSIVNNSALDCQLKLLAQKFGAKALSGGTARMAELGPRLAEALNVAACSGLGIESQPEAAVVVTPTSVEGALAELASRADCDVAEVLQIYVSPAGSDTKGSGSVARPYATIAKAMAEVALSQPQRRGPVAVFLRAGTYFEPVVVRSSMSGIGATSPVVVAGFPGEHVVISGGVRFRGLPWVPVTMAASGAAAFKAALPAAAAAQLAGGSFTGLFGDGKRLTRARYPNCDDLNGASCFSLNASGAMTGGTPFPMTDVTSVSGGVNLQVQNQHGIDIFAPSTDSAPATGPRGASDGTLSNGTTLTLVVDHPDYAWRCHDDSTFGSGFSTWRSYVPSTNESGSGAAGVTNPSLHSRFDGAYNEQFWDTQVSYGLTFNATEPPTPWAPGWTPRSWASPETGVAHV